MEPSSGRTDALDLTFLNHNAAFKSKTTWEVLRAYLVFQLCSITPLVANNEKVRPDKTFYSFTIDFSSNSSYYRRL